MKRLFYLALLLCLGSPAYAQAVGRVGVYGGYAYASADENGSRENFNGWQAGVDAKVIPMVAIEGDISGYYRTDAVFVGSGFGTANVKLSDYVFMGGPKVNLGPVFVHALFGVDHLSGTSVGISASDNSFATALGGGLQIKLVPHVAFRPSIDYLMTRHFSNTQNNIRIGAGLEFTF